MTAPETPPAGAGPAASAAASSGSAATAGPSSPASDAQPAAAAHAAPQGSAGCPPHVLEAIYGRSANKAAQYDTSLKRWWLEYVDRKNDEDEHVADSLLYDKRHLPRTTPAPDVVLAALAAEKEDAQRLQPVVLATERLTLES